MACSRVALFMVETLVEDTPIRRAPAINGRAMPSAAKQAAGAAPA